MDDQPDVLVQILNGDVHVLSAFDQLHVGPGQNEVEAEVFDWTAV